MELHDIHNALVLYNLVSTKIQYHLHERKKYDARRALPFSAPSSQGTIGPRIIIDGERLNLEDLVVGVEVVVETANRAGRGGLWRRRGEARGGDGNVSEADVKKRHRHARWARLGIV
ncbi:hypothetical protein C1H46_023079 [Malus baccata]|uniref:Uncharacterized protein n=1 Tax=Malus baccata TaxID=106549 RepID=A0A540LY16_MALBA|nr:hypothetical protein C1H46_023079 [Malus baccata]